MVPAGEAGKLERLQKSVMRIGREGENWSRRKGLPALRLLYQRRWRDGMATIYSSLQRGEKGDKGGLFLLAVKLVTRSSGWEAAAVICLS